MALINPCDIQTGSVHNTGIECSAALGVAKGMYIIPANYTWTATEMADTAAFFRTRIHAAATSRFYPVLKGIFEFALATEGDVTEANPLTGTSSRIRLGGFTFTYTYEDGGMCLAKALRSFQGKGYRVIFVDQNSQMLVRKNANGTYSGLKTSDISNSIAPTTGTTKFKNILVLGVNQDEYINNSELLKSDVDITDNNGLIETEVFKAATPTATKLTVGVRTECAKTDLVAVYSAATMADLDLYVVTNKATGAVVIPTSGAVVAGKVELTFGVGALTSGQTYIVKGSLPSVWLANLVEGYDASTAAALATDAEHLIP